MQVVLVVLLALVGVLCMASIYPSEARSTDRNGTAFLWTSPDPKCDGGSSFIDSYWSPAACHRAGNNNNNIVFQCDIGADGMLNVSYHEWSSNNTSCKGPPDLAIVLSPVSPKTCTANGTFQTGNTTLKLYYQAQCKPTRIAQLQVQ